MNIKLTATGDLDFSSGQLQLVEGSSEVAQKLRVRYRFFRGEWFLDTRVGVPYHDVIFKKGVDLNTVRSYLMRVALTCPGIASLSEFDIELDVATRVLTVELVAILTSGETLDFSEAFVI